MIRSNRRPRSIGRLAKYIRDCERGIILSAIRQSEGNNGKAAEWLGVSTRALYAKMRDYGLEGEAAALRTEKGISGPRMDYHPQSNKQRMKWGKLLPGEIWPSSR